MDEVHHDQGPAEHQHCSVFPCVREHFLAGTQEDEQGIPEEEHPAADHHAGSQRRVKTEGADPANVIRRLFSEQAGDQGAAALAEDIAESHQDHEQRRADRYPGDEQRVVRPGDEEGVRQVIDDGDDGAHHHRQRQAEIGRDDPFGIQACGFLLFFHVVYSPANGFCMA